MSVVECNPSTELPIIDLDGLKPNSPDRPAIAKELDRAFRRIGFCYIANTGIDPALTDACFAASRSFHALPDADKHAISINAFHRGYIAPKSSVIRSSSVARVTQPNLSESFMMMHEVAADDPRHGEPLQGPNQWPAALPHFRQAVTAYSDAMTDMAGRFTRLLALALGLEEDFFAAYFARPTTWLRLLHYPPHPQAAPEDQYGAAPHTDYGFITLLAQDSLGGLEVRARDGSWIAAPPIPGTLIVNVADMLARWSNDRWTSTPHRVRNLSDTDRFSLPFFYDPDTRSRIECLPGCSGPDAPPRYEPVIFGDYVVERLNRNYAYRHAPRTESRPMA